MTHEPRHAFNNTLCTFVCQCNNALKLRPPKLYEMTSDPGETTPVNSSSSEYGEVVAHIQNAINAHKLSLQPVESQFTLPKLMWRPFLQPCCNGTFPNCQCVDEKFSKLNQK